MIQALKQSRVGRLALAGLGSAVVVTVAGLLLLWPYDGVLSFSHPGTASSSDAAVVQTVSTEGCSEFAGPECRLVTFKLLSGPNEGETSTFSFTDQGDQLAPPVSPGDAIRVLPTADFGLPDSQEGQIAIDEPSTQPYAFVDFERSGWIYWLALAFGLLVVVLSRWRGFLSLLGLGISLVLLTTFIVPAILAGKSPLAVAIIGSLAVMFVTIGLAHGFSPKSVAALMGTTVSLLITALLATAAVGVANISGFSSEEATLLLGASGGTLSLQGLVLAGMVIGALGVLDDVTVSQASTVMAIRRANPGLSIRELYREGISVGRDHLSATVNTLVLAYAGASLPIMLLFSTQGTSLNEVLSREPVAEAVIATLVGSIGLIAAVPLTTVLAAFLASALPPAALDADEHVHQH